MSFLKNFFNQNINRDLDSLRKRWTKSITIISSIVYFIITLSELIVFFLFNASGRDNFHPDIYFKKFFFFPLVVNGIIIGLMHLTNKTTMKDGTKSYVVSFLFVMMIFTMNIVHSVFPVILVAFSVPGLLSVVYSDKRLTNTTTVFALIMEIIAEFFITWDKSRPLPFASIDNFATVLVTFMTQIGLYIISLQILKFEIIKLKLTKDFEIERYHLMQEAMKDGLTGMNNRNAFDKHIEDISNNHLPEDSFIFVMMDLDNFKQINDNIGHSEGDRALETVSGIILKEASKLHGNVFRYGGDEFVLIFRNEKANDVYKICKDIKETFRNSTTKEMDELNVSLSFGMAEHSEKNSFLQTLKIADDQMYIYKNRHKQKN